PCATRSSGSFALEVDRVKPVTRSRSGIRRCSPHAAPHGARPPPRPGRIPSGPALPAFRPIAKHGGVDVMDPALLREASSLADRGVACALAVVVDAKGSVPGKPGATM